VLRVRLRPQSLLPCHQRTIYAASFPTVPLLLENVGLPGKREEIFALLAGTPEGVQTPREERK